MHLRLLSVPFVFQLQQRVFNDYGNVKKEFDDYLERGPLRILDIGCSTGACGQAIFDMTRDDYVGIDITERYAKYASRTYARGTYMAMDGRSLRFEDEHFDVVSFIGVLHHMDDETARRSLDEARRVLKADGVLLVAEPVFTANDLRSNLFLSIDRGKHIRESSEYEALASAFRVERKRYFRLSFHRFLSLVGRR